MGPSLVRHCWTLSAVPWCPQVLRRWWLMASSLAFESAVQGKLCPGMTIWGSSRSRWSLGTDFSEIVLQGQVGLPNLWHLLSPLNLLFSSQRFPAPPAGPRAPCSPRLCSLLQILASPACFFSCLCTSLMEFSSFKAHSLIAHVLTCYPVSRTHLSATCSVSLCWWIWAGSTPCPLSASQAPLAAWVPTPGCRMKRCLTPLSLTLPGRPDSVSWAH